MHVEMSLSTFPVSMIIRSQMCLSLTPVQFKISNMKGLGFDPTYHHCNDMYLWMKGFFLNLQLRLGFDAEVYKWQSDVDR